MKFVSTYYNDNLQIPSRWVELIDKLPARKSFLEIGSREGRSAQWIIESLMEDGGVLYCVDPWEDGIIGNENQSNMNAIKRAFDINIKEAKNQFPERTVNVICKRSDFALSYLFLKDIKFDFILIDGSHHAEDVLLDACLSWKLLKQNGIIIFDDYVWKSSGYTCVEPDAKPSLAIDSFMSIYKNYEILHKGHQVILRKIM